MPKANIFWSLNFAPKFRGREQKQTFWGFPEIYTAVILWPSHAMTSQEQAYGNRRAFLKKIRLTVSTLPAMMRYGDPLVLTLA